MVRFSALDDTCFARLVSPLTPARFCSMRACCAFSPAHTGCTARWLKAPRWFRSTFHAVLCLVRARNAPAPPAPAILLYTMCAALVSWHLLALRFVPSTYSLTREKYWFVLSLPYCLPSPSVYCAFSKFALLNSACVGARATLPASQRGFKATFISSGLACSAGWFVPA